MNRLKLILQILLIVMLCISVGRFEPEISAQTDVSKNKEAEKTVGNFSIATQYWAVPRPPAMVSWHAVFGGTVIETKNRKEFHNSADLTRKYVDGSVKIERIFLDFPSDYKVSVGNLYSSEGFDGLKKGDKVIVFVNSFYEGEFTRVHTAGTNTLLGFKVKNWKEPIVSVLEKVAPCNKIEDGRVEGHPKDFKKKLYNCYEEREKLILDNPEFAEIWKKYDPQGFQELLERREILEQ